MESFFHSLKAERLHGRFFATAGDLRAQLARYARPTIRHACIPRSATDHPLTMNALPRRTLVSAELRDHPGALLHPERSAAEPRSLGRRDSIQHTFDERCDQMPAIGTIAGDYKGVGQWYDSGGKSGSYQVVQTNRALADGFEVSFHHDFDDGSVTEARLTLSNLAPHIYRVAIAQNAVGHGSWLDDTLHYHLEVGGKFVEAGYRSNGHELLVSGSSTRNAEGNYIVWIERLRRVSSD